MDVTTINHFITDNGGLISIFTLMVGSIILGLFKSGKATEIISAIIDALPGKKKKIEENNIRKISESDIINHELFSYAGFWLNNKIPSLKLKTEFRTVVFRDYLNVFFTKFVNNIQHFINQGVYKNMDNTQMRKELFNILNTTLIEIDNELRNKKVPNIIIHKMRVLNSSKIGLMTDLVHSICDSSFYDSENNYLKIFSFLNVVYSILDNTIVGAESLFNSLNGELLGLNYKGAIESKPQ
jgi:hypothetical protein